MNEAATITDITTATGEILVMLAGAFILGWIARWVYELVVYAPLWIEGHTDDFITEHDGTTIRHHEDIVMRRESQEQSDTDTTSSKTSKQKEKTETKAESVTTTTHTDRQVDAMQSPVTVMPYKQDDLKMVEGIGPKIAELLHNGGISTWQELAETDPEDIKTILRAAGERYRIHDPTTWPEQAQLAVEHKWEELEEYQGALSGGKDLTRIYKNKSTQN